jgi:protein-S-isoprenylcysteine O-methyltransferase Ste14
MEFLRGGNEDGRLVRTLEKEAVARKQRRSKRKSENRPRARSKRNKQAQESAPSVSWKWYAAVILLAVALFSVFIVTQFDPIDRRAMAGAVVFCVGLGLLIPGTCKAVGSFEFQEDSWIHKGLNYLAALATPNRRFGELFYSRSALYVIFEKILIALVLPMGFIMVFLRPKQTWPAIVWVGGGILATFLGWAVCVWEAN